MRYRTIVELVRLLEANPKGLTVAEMIARLRLQDIGMEYQNTAVHLQETPLSQDQKFEELDGDRCRISASVVLLNEIIWWLSN